MAFRKRNLYDPTSENPFKVSRSKIELFIECPKCFYIDRRQGLGRPPGFPFNLNSAVDELLKNEFDYYRSLSKPHPLMLDNDVEAVPFVHPDLDVWRENFKGFVYHHEPTDLIITGAVDDIWINKLGQLIVVDYKSTSKNDEIISLDEDWHDTYKRQLEIYQWLLEKNGFEVSEDCYWVYANGDRKKPRFNASLSFRMTVINYKGNFDWVEGCVLELKKCLESDRPPKASSDCPYCDYVDLRFSLAKTS